VVDVKYYKVLSSEKLSIADWREDGAKVKVNSIERSLDSRS